MRPTFPRSGACRRIRVNGSAILPAATVGFGQNVDSWRIWRTAECRSITKEKVGNVAQRVEILLVDDLDGSDASDTVAFSLDGVQYELDLNDQNAAGLREALKPYIASARRAPSRSGRRRRAHTPMRSRPA